MKRRLKTAVIGVGNMGRHHVRVYSEISDLVAVAEINTHLGESVAKEYGVKLYSDYKEMLANEAIDAVSVVVPTSFHESVVIDCLTRRIPTLVEKPIANELSEAQHMIRLAKRMKTFLMVGHIERFNPAILRLKKLLDNKQLGDIIGLLAVRVGLFPPKTPQSDVALDLGIHDIDIFNFLLDQYPLESKIIRHKIFKSSQSDAASMLFKYKRCTALIQTNWITPIKMRKLYITGTEGFADLDYITQKLTIYNKIINIKYDIDYNDIISLYNAPQKDIYISRKEPLKQQLLFFLQSAREKNPQLDYATAAARALEILQNTT